MPSLYYNSAEFATLTTSSPSPIVPSLFVNMLSKKKKADNFGLPEIKIMLNCIKQVLPITTCKWEAVTKDNTAQADSMDMLWYV